MKNLNDWLTGDTLVLLNKAGIMSPDSSTLHFVKEAEKYFSQKQLERIASLANPSLSSPQLQPDQQQQRRLSITMRLDNDDFDIAEFMKHYDAKKRKSENDKDIDSNSNSNKPKPLTLADLEGRPSGRTFFKDSDSD